MREASGCATWCHHPPVGIIDTYRAICSSRIPLLLRKQVLASIASCRPTNVKTLSVVTTDVTQKVELIGGLDTFGDYV